jgi:hypothetical protein
MGHGVGGSWSQVDEVSTTTRPEQSRAEQSRAEQSRVEKRREEKSRATSQPSSIYLLSIPCPPRPVASVSR